MDITPAFEAVVGGSNPSGGTITKQTPEEEFVLLLIFGIRRVFQKYELFYFLAFGVTQNPIYLPSIRRVCASSPGSEPNIMIVRNINGH